MGRDGRKICVFNPDIREEAKFIKKSLAQDQKRHRSCYENQGISCPQRPFLNVPVKPRIKGQGDKGCNKNNAKKNQKCTVESQGFEKHQVFL